MGREFLSKPYLPPPPTVAPPKYQKWSIWNAFNPDDDKFFEEAVNEDFIVAPDVAEGDQDALSQHHGEQESLVSTPVSVEGDEPPELRLDVLVNLAREVRSGRRVSMSLHTEGQSRMIPHADASTEPLLEIANSEAPDTTISLPSHTAQYRPSSLFDRPLPPLSHRGHQDVPSDHSLTALAAFHNSLMNPVRSTRIQT